MPTNTTNSTNQVSTAPEAEGKHQHTCVKCGQEYVHYHSYKRVDHPQFSFQCPNADCEWFYEKGQSKGPDAAPATSEETPAPKQDNSKPTPKTESYRERSVRIAYTEGKIHCPNVNHFRLVAIKGEKYKQVLPLGAADLLKMMEVGVKPKCACERDALREAWNFNVPGVYETEWVQPGCMSKGWPTYKVGDIPRRVMPLGYNLTPAQVSYLHKQHPGWLFVSTGTQFHDHPVAHATSQIATFNLFHGLKKGRYLDLHGNPSAAETFNREKNGRSIVTMVNVESPKDVVRKATKWGPAKDGERVRYVESALRDLPQNHEALLKSVDGLTSVHTLYYYDFKEISRALVASKGRRLDAIIHRHHGAEGKMNNGEQSWVKVHHAGGRVEVEQTNVTTGEKYRHPCTEKWFANTSWSPYRGEAAAGHQDEECALAWTINKCADGVYHLTIVPCTVREANMDTSYVSTPKAMVVNSAEYIAATGFVDLKTPVEEIKVHVAPEERQFFEDLRLKMMGAKVRDAAKYKAHCQYVALKYKSVMKEQDMIKCAQRAHDMAYASFWVDQDLDATSHTLLGSDGKRIALDVMVTCLSGGTLRAGFADSLRALRTFM